MSKKQWHIAGWIIVTCFVIGGLLIAIMAKSVPYQIMGMCLSLSGAFVGVLYRDMLRKCLNNDSEH